MLWNVALAATYTCVVRRTRIREMMALPVGVLWILFLFYYRISKSSQREHAGNNVYRVTYIEKQHSVKSNKSHCTEPPQAAQYNKQGWIPAQIPYSDIGHRICTTDPSEDNSQTQRITFAPLLRTSAQGPQKDYLKLHTLNVTSTAKSKHTYFIASLDCGKRKTLSELLWSSRIV